MLNVSVRPQPAAVAAVSALAATAGKTSSDEILVERIKDVLRLVALLAHGDAGDEVDHFAEHHLSSAGRL
jgi:hypothetical protein